MNPDRLHDVIEPAAVSWIPQTLGWAVLAAVIILVVTRVAWTRYHTWHAAAYRREALAELAEIRAAMGRHVDEGPDSGSSAALTALPSLVKRVVLASSDRTAVAALSGPRWLEYLDRSYSRPAFSDGPGRLLLDMAYTPASNVERLPASDVDALFTLLEDWISAHHVPDGPAADGSR